MWNLTPVWLLTSCLDVQLSWEIYFHSLLSLLIEHSISGVRVLTTEIFNSWVFISFILTQGSNSYHKIIKNSLRVNGLWLRMKDIICIRYLHLYICNICMCIYVWLCGTWLCTCVSRNQTNKHPPFSPRRVSECWRLSRSPGTSPPLLGYLCGHGGCVSTKPRKQLQPANPDMSTHTSGQQSGRLNTAAIHS